MSSVTRDPYVNAKSSAFAFGILDHSACPEAVREDLDIAYLIARMRDGVNLDINIRKRTQRRIDST